MNVVLTGGGTGGHVYPALAIAEALAGEPALAPLRLLYVGTRDRIEAQIVPKAGIALEFVRAAPLERRIGFGAVRTLRENLRGLGDAYGVLQRFAPDVVIATGGYVAFPVVAAARLRRWLGRSRVKIALLEPNAGAGLTNRLLAPLVDELWIAFPGAGGAHNRRTIVTGTPVREAFLHPLDAQEARRSLALAPERTTVVAIGGSQGARSLNDAVAGSIESGSVPWQTLHVTGPAHFEDVRRREAAAVARGDAQVVAYLEDPRAAYAAADLVIARAGASTLAELAAAAVPAILVPYPYATADHQRRNAEAFVALGAARLLPDAELSPDRLSAEVRAALAPDARAAMRSAAQRLARNDARAAIAARVKRWSPAKGTQP